MSKKQRKGPQRRGKYPNRPIINTKDPATREQFYKATDKDAPLGRYQIVAGSVQHPDTGLWQVWVSTNGLDFTQVAAFKEARKAAASVVVIQQEGSAGHLSDQEIVEALFETLKEESDGPALPLPETLIRKLARDILHRVIEEPLANG
jgi:hypothetical protein